jgi:hypothetical protein
LRIAIAIASSVLGQEGVLEARKKAKHKTAKVTHFIKGR